MNVLRVMVLSIVIILDGLLSPVLSQVFRTQIFSSSIKTLQIGRYGDKYASNMISLTENEKLVVRFDEMSHNSHAYSYKVIHCNADWTESAISSNEYLQGFLSLDISDYTRSNSTTVLYTHYKFELPNDQMKFKISGNYVALIYEDNKTEKPVAQVCFTVYEPKVTIEHTLRCNTDIELNGRFQQLDFDIKLQGVNVQIPQDELKVVVRQNNRFDNEVFGVQPTYINGSVFSFKNNRSLIFEGGNEYHSVDLSSVYVATRGVDRIRFEKPNYVAYLRPQKATKPMAYEHEFDANGKFVVNSQEAVGDVNTDADYLLVHFSVDSPEPFLDGRVYVGGDFNYNLLNDKSMMNYDFQLKRYLFSTLLKQGGYNYQYWFLRKSEFKSSVEKMEGSFWQTTNEYSIYVYYRPIGALYDRLVGIKVIGN